MKGGKVLVEGQSLPQEDGLRSEPYLLAVPKLCLVLTIKLSTNCENYFMSERNNDKKKSTELLAKSAFLI